MNTAARIRNGGNRADITLRVRSGQALLRPEADGAQSAGAVKPPLQVLLMAILACFAFVEAGAAQSGTPKPALVVLNKDASELAIVDPGTLKVVGRVPTGPIPHEVAVSEDGKIAVATNYGEHQNGTTLSVIDLDAQKEIHRVELKDLVGPHGILFFDGKAWFTAEGSKKIARYDPVTNRVDWEHEIGENRTHMLGLATGTPYLRPT
jgi:hypothetical protein